MKAPRMTEAEFDVFLARKHAKQGVSVPKTSKTLPRGQIKAGRSELEAELQAQIERALLPTPEYDVPYLIGSRHRLDVAWRFQKFGVEVQGAVHRIKGKFRADIDKRAAGLLQGWVILEVDREAIYSGKAIEWIRQLLSPDRRAASLCRYHADSVELESDGRCRASDGGATV